MKDSHSEKYSRGRRGAPAKGIGRLRGARVQIPPSPFHRLKKKVKKTVDNISNLWYYLTVGSNTDADI